MEKVREDRWWSVLGVVWRDWNVGLWWYKGRAVVCGMCYGVRAT